MATKRDKLHFVLLMVGILLLGLVFLISLHWIPEQWVVRRILVGGFGEALIVAAILALTADRYIKSDIVHEIFTDAHKYLVGYHLPEEMKERIQEVNLYLTSIVTLSFSSGISV